MKGCGHPRAVENEKSSDQKQNLGDRDGEEEPRKEKEKEMVRDVWGEPGGSGYHFSQNDKRVKDLFTIKCNREQSPKLRTKLKNIHWDG